MSDFDHMKMRREIDQMLTSERRVLNAPMPDETMRSELAPCPFCGSEAVREYESDHGYYAMLCTACSAEGPAQRYRSDAPTAWNRRAYAAPGGEPCQSMCEKPCSPNRGLLIDSEYASRLAFMLECLIVDYHGHWDAACKLLDEYKAEWERIDPSPPTFMGEPVPIDRRERFQKVRADRAAISESEGSSNA